MSGRRDRGCSLRIILSNAALPAFRGSSVGTGRPESCDESQRRSDCLPRPAAPVPSNQLSVYGYSMLYAKDDGVTETGLREVELYAVEDPEVSSAPAVYRHPSFRIERSGLRNKLFPCPSTMIQKPPDAGPGPPGKSLHHEGHYLFPCFHAPTGTVAFQEDRFMTP